MNYNRSYIESRPLVDGATAFMVMEEDETVTIYAKYPHTPPDEVCHEVYNVGLVPRRLVEEVEKRPTWTPPMTKDLEKFAIDMWLEIVNLDSWYIFA